MTVTTIPSSYAEFTSIVEEQVKLLPPSECEYRRKKQRGKMMLDLLYHSDSWVIESNDNGFEVSKIHLDGLKYPFVRGRQLYKNEKLARVFNVIRSPETRSFWDHGFDGYNLLEFIGDGMLVAQSRQKGIFPVSGRDLVTLLANESDGRQADSIAVSIKHVKGPECKGRVRAECMIAAWRLIQTEEGVDATYICSVDPKGSIPSSVFKMLLSQIVNCVPQVDVYLKQKGTAIMDLVQKPFEPGTDVKVLDGEFNHNSFHTTLKIAESNLSEKGVIFFALPARMESKIDLIIKGGRPRASIVQGIEDLVGDMIVLKIWNDSSADRVEISCKTGSANLLNGKSFC